VKEGYGDKPPCGADKNKPNLCITAGSAEIAELLLYILYPLRSLRTLRLMNLKKQTQSPAFGRKPEALSSKS
jgi:hypothetical protein